MHIYIERERARERNTHPNICKEQIETLRYTFVSTQKHKQTGTWRDLHVHTLQWRAVPVRFKGNLPRTCHLSLSKKNTLRKKEKVKLKKYTCTHKEKCHKDLIKSREEGNNEDSVYFWAALAQKGQRKALFKFIRKWPPQQFPWGDNGKFQWYFKNRLNEHNRDIDNGNVIAPLSNTWLGCQVSLI